MVNFYDIFNPCFILYPFSPTLASTSRSKVNENNIYRSYIILISLLVTGNLINYVYFYTYIAKQHWTILTIPCFLTLFAIYFAMMAAASYRAAKKNKINKLMDEINVLNDAEFNINERKYKLSTGFCTILLVSQYVMRIAIFVFYGELKTLYLLSLCFINMWTNCELLAYAGFVSIFEAKLRCFVSLLQQIAEKREVGHYQLYERCRQLLYINKKINNAWKHQIMVIVPFEVYFTTRVVLRLMLSKADFSTFLSAGAVIFNYALFAQHLFIFLILGLVGQRVAEGFRQIATLSGTIHDMDLGEELKHQTWQISKLVSVCSCRLAVPFFVVDGQLPLRAVSTVISTVILIMQFGIAFD